MLYTIMIHFVNQQNQNSPSSSWWVAQLVFFECYQGMVEVHYIIPVNMEHWRQLVFYSQLVATLGWKMIMEPPGLGIWEVGCGSVEICWFQTDIWNIREDDGLHVDVGEIAIQSFFHLRTRSQMWTKMAEWCMKVSSWCEGWTSMSRRTA